MGRAAGAFHDLQHAPIRFVEKIHDVRILAGGVHVLLHVFPCERRRGEAAQKDDKYSRHKYS